MKLYVNNLLFALLFAILFIGMECVPKNKNVKQASIIKAPRRHCSPGLRWANGSCRQVFPG